MGEKIHTSVCVYTQPSYCGYPIRNDVLGYSARNIHTDPWGDNVGRFYRINAQLARPQCHIFRMLDPDNIRSCFRMFNLYEQCGKP